MSTYFGYCKLCGQLWVKSKRDNSMQYCSNEHAEIKRRELSTISLLKIHRERKEAKREARRLERLRAKMTPPPPLANINEKV